MSIRHFIKAEQKLQICTRRRQQIDWEKRKKRRQWSRRQLFLYFQTRCRRGGGGCCICILVFECVRINIILIANPQILSQLPSGSLAMTVVLRSTMPLLLSTVLPAHTYAKCQWRGGFIYDMMMNRWSMVSKHEGRTDLLCFVGILERLFLRRLW